MRIVHVCLLASLPFVSAHAVVLAARALQSPLDRPAIDRALQVARGTDRERERFHDRYVTRVDDPVVEEVEVITEFRRLVLIAEERRRQGNWIFTRSAHDAEQALQPWRGVVTLVARLRFNPLNVYATVPPYELLVATADHTVTPIAAKIDPVFSEPFPTRDGSIGATAILGAVLENRFDAASLGSGPGEVRIVLDRATVARVPVDFGRIE